MPEINFDTLFIVGLILASVIGQIFKKKEQDTEQKKDNNSDFEPSLNDVVKEFWSKATGELQNESSTPPPLPEKIDYDESKDPIDYDEEKPIKSVEFQKEVELVESDYDYNSDLDITPKPTVSNKIHQLLSSPSSLKTSFLIKEILDPPISLRDRHQ